MITGRSVVASQSSVWLAGNREGSCWTGNRFSSALYPEYADQLPASLPGGGEFSFSHGSSPP